LFQDQPFSIPVDHIDCRVGGDFHLSAPVEALRQATWQATVAKRPTAFDGALLRLDGHRLCEDRLRLAASRTTFSAYVATRDPHFSDDHPGEARADPLGMTAIVTTADHQAIVTRRSLTADQNPGALYFVGGYAEPRRIGDTVDLFADVAREVAEEIAVTDLDRGASYAIGLAYDPLYCHPELIFLAVSASTAAAILAGAHRAPDRDEAAELTAVPISDLLEGRGGPAHAPRTWSYTTSRAFLARHLRDHPL
jgi:hypothetical protein